MAQPTLASIQAQAQAMLSRLASEGITNSSGQQTHTYNQGTNTFTPVAAAPTPPVPTPQSTTYITYGPGSPNYNPGGNNNYVSYNGGTPTPATGNEPGVIWNHPTGGSVDRTVAPVTQAPTNTMDALMSLWTPEKEDQIRQKFLSAVQPWVDTINAQTGLLTAEQERLRTEQQGRNRAMLSRSGLIGGMEEQRTVADIDQYNLQKKQELLNAQNQKIESVKNEARKMAEENILNTRNTALRAAESKLSAENTAKLTDASLRQTEQAIASSKQAMQQQSEAFKTSQRDKALSLIKELGNANTDWATLDYSTKQSLLEFSGLDEKMAGLIMNSYKDAANKVDYKLTVTNNDQIIGIGTDPRTGEPVQETWNLPTGWSQKLQGYQLKIDNGMLIGYKTDPNGNPMPETIVVDAKIAQTLSALKNQEQGNAKPANLDAETDKIYAGIVKNYTASQARNVLNWLTSGSPQEILDKQSYFKSNVGSLSIGYEQLMSKLNSFSNIK